HRALEVLEVRVEPPDDLAGRGLHRRVVERAATRELAAEEDVRRRVEVVRERKRLIDGLDPERLRIARIADRDRLAADEDLTRVGESTSKSTMPERSDCITTAPRIAPGTVPMPPANDVPPMTAAEITSSSFCTPRFVTAASRRAVCTAALIAASAPMSAKVSMIVRRTLRPASAAASGLPPIAYT